MRTVAACIAVLFCTTTCASALADDSRGEPGPPIQLAPFAAEFLVGNTAFIALHEFGHALIREFEVPLLGLEEDSADTVAAMTLLALDQDHPDERPRVAELLAMAVLGNLLIWQTGAEKDNPAVALWSQHNLSIKRYTRTLCLLYGSNPGLFQWIAEMAKMPDLRADWCEDEYQAARRGMEWLVSSYGDGRSGRSLRPNGRVSVEYGRPRSELQEAARQFLQKRQILERTAAFADTRFRFPQPFAVRVRACGQPNAFWDADDRELLFCYEMLEWLLQLSASPEVSRVAEAFAARRHDDAPGADAVR